MDFLSEYVRDNYPNKILMIFSNAKKNSKDTRNSNSPIVNSKSNMIFCISYFEMQNYSSYFIVKCTVSGLFDIEWK